MFAAATCLTQSAGHFASIKEAATGTTTHMDETVQVHYIQIYYILQVEKQSLLIYSNPMFVFMNLFNECQPRTERERKNVRKLLWARLSEVTKAKPDVKETFFLNIINMPW